MQERERGMEKLVFNVQPTITVLLGQRERSFSIYQSLLVYLRLGSMQTISLICSRLTYSSSETDVGYKVRFPVREKHHVTQKDDR